MAEKELPLDAPPSYPSASVTVPYAAPPGNRILSWCYSLYIVHLSDISGSHLYAS